MGIDIWLYNRYSIFLYIPTSKILKKKAMIFSKKASMITESFPFQFSEEPVRTFRRTSWLLWQWSPDTNFLHGNHSLQIEYLQCAQEGFSPVQRTQQNTSNRFLLCSQKQYEPKVQINKIEETNVKNILIDTEVKLTDYLPEKNILCHSDSLYTMKKNTNSSF